MKKNELIHLHSLLRLLKQRFQGRGEVSHDPFEAYDSLGLRPEQVFKSKQLHETAVLLLAEQLAAELNPADAGELEETTPETDVVASEKRSLWRRILQR